MGDEKLDNLRTLFQERFPFDVIQTIYVEMNKNFDDTMDRLFNYEAYYGQIPQPTSKKITNIESRVSELSTIYIIVAGYIRINYKGINNDIILPVDVIKIIVTFYAFSVQNERELKQKIGYKLRREHEIWYPISKKWMDIWLKYICYNTGDKDIPGGIENMHKLKLMRPGIIDNSHLQGISIFVILYIIL